MIIRYSIHGGRRPPRDREILAIQEDGTFTLWRSVGSASEPPSPIGQFSGQIEEPLFQALQAEAAPAAQSGDLILRIPPGSSIEQVSLGEQGQAKLGIHGEPEGAWGVLMNRLRPLVGSLTAQPTAAIGLEVSADGQQARLHHLGTQPLRLELSEIEVRAVLWQDEWDQVGDWWMPEENRTALTATQAETGWSLELPFDHGFDVSANQEVVAYVNFTVFDEDIPVEVSLESIRTGV